jgi:prepilin-type N-terminal cleavage/methylation domain-containing protein
MAHPHQSGFTLVELLVVITIIGILIALLLPAVQSAREAARITQCQNNIKQLALGCLGHEAATKRFPTGGWGWAWTGDPDRGNDWRQPGGWIYNVLPYIEQQVLHDLGAGTALGSAAKLSADSLRVSTPLTCIDCPSRRQAIVYPWGHAAAWWTFPTNMNAPSMNLLTSRNDYAACGGEYWTYAAWPHPVQAPYSGPSPALSSNGGYTYVDDPHNSDRWAVATTTQVSPYWPGGVPGPARAHGVSFALSMIGAKDVTDGLSNTFLLGEKEIDPDHYTDSEQAGDSAFALEGMDFGIERFANDYSDCPDCTAWDVEGPHPDTPGYEYDCSFGGPHFLGVNMALCDGSVRMVNYTIDLATYSHLANRCDGQVIDFKKAF